MISLPHRFGSKRNDSLVQVATEAEVQRCSQLLTEEELLECSSGSSSSGGDDSGTQEGGGVRRERILARALVRCERTTLAFMRSGAWRSGACSVQSQCTFPSHIP